MATQAGPRARARDLGPGSGPPTWARDLSQGPGPGIWARELGQGPGAGTWATGDGKNFARKGAPRGPLGPPRGPLGGPGGPLGPPWAPWAPGAPNPLRWVAEKNGNPPRKSTFWHFWSKINEKWTPAGGGRAAGGHANSDPTGVYPPTQDCYPPAGGDDAALVALQGLSRATTGGADGQSLSVSRVLVV